MIQEIKFLFKEKCILFLYWLCLPLVLGMLSLVLFRTVSSKEQWFITSELTVFFTLVSVFLCYNIHVAFQSMYSSFETSMLFGKTRSQFIFSDFLTDIFITVLFSAILFSYFLFVAQDMLKIWPYVSETSSQLAFRILPFSRILVYSGIVMLMSRFVWRTIYQFGWISILIFFLLIGMVLAISYFRIAMPPIKGRYLALILSSLLYIVSSFLLRRKDMAIFV